MVRKSRGNLVIEMEKDANCGEFTEVVKETLGKNQAIRRLARRITYKIKDINPTIEKEELKQGLEKKLEVQESETQSIEVKTIRFGYAGTRTAMVVLPMSAAEKIGDEAKIKIGFTSCRIRRTFIRCFRCHEFGHMTYSCTKNLQGKEICRRCGTKGHQIDRCKAIRCYILCTREGIPAAKAEHVAGAVNCPQYRKYVEQVSERNEANSN